MGYLFKILCICHLHFQDFWVVASFTLPSLPYRYSDDCYFDPRSRTLCFPQFWIELGWKQFIIINTWLSLSNGVWFWNFFPWIQVGSDSQYWEILPWKCKPRKKFMEEKPPKSMPVPGFWELRRRYLKIHKLQRRKLQS